MAAALALVADIGADTVIAPFATAAMLRVAALSAIPAVDETSGLEIGLTAVFVSPADGLALAVMVSLTGAAVLFAALHAVAT